MGVPAGPRGPGERLRCADGRAGWEPFGYHPKMGGYPGLFNHLLKILRYSSCNSSIERMKKAQS